MRVLILRRAADDGARLQQLFDRLDADAGLSIVESSADILPPADHDPRFEFVILSPAYAEERSLAAVARAFPGSRVMAIIERADGWSLLGRDGLADGGRTFPAMESLAGAIRQVLRAHGSGNTRREAIERRTRQLAHLGRYDPLTGLYEVGYLDVLFGDQRTIIDRRGCVTAYVVNLDGFSRVNQTHGYVCGDRLLRTVAECVAAFAGSQGVACRLASDEFLAIVTMHDNVAAILGGQRLCRQIRRLRVRSGAGEVGATVSVGMSEVADGNLSPDDIDRARAASSTAKYLGGDRACGWEWASFLQSARPDLRDRALSDEIRLDRLLARMRATMSVTPLDACGDARPGGCPVVRSACGCARSGSRGAGESAHRRPVSRSGQTGGPGDDTGEAHLAFGGPSACCWHSTPMMAPSWRGRWDCPIGSAS
jgi:diguanylate cyclase (GGDEF)-like protein